MHYYRLNEDVEIPNRLHIGKVLRGSSTALDLLNGHPVDQTELHTEVTTPGRILDFFLTNFAVPIARKELADVIQRISGECAQLLPITIGSANEFCVINATKTVDCLDEQQSEFIKWTRA